MASLILAVLAGVAGASALVPTPDPPAGPERVEPDGSPPVIRNGVEDPSGQQRWVLRRYRSKDGSVCTEVGRVQDGVFGRVDPDKTFHPLELDPSGTGNCGPVDEEHPFTFSVGHYAARGDREATATVFGVATTAVKDVVVKLADRVERATFDRGSFLLVLPDADLAGATTTIAFTDGSTQVKELHSLDELRPVAAP